jgi:hypothetical protein
MTRKAQKRTGINRADGYNPLTRSFWAEGEEGRKRGSKVPPASRKKKRRKK